LKLAAGEGSITAADIIAGTGWGKSKAYELLKRAEELGCMVEAGGASTDLLGVPLFRR